MNNEQNILTVSQLTTLIKQQLESSFTAVSLQGEVSNFRKQSSGHLYFTLKDSGAQIAAVMFKGSTSGLRLLPKDGDKVIVKGEINVYPARGNYQLMVKELSLQGVGELLLRLEQLKIKLYKKGYFAKEHKKPLPKDPHTLALITSPTGAAIRDMLNVLGRRQAGLQILVYPVKVQGDGAAEEIATAIDELNRYKLCDLILVGRGGGSIEDLWAFNEEIVADAIFRSQIPIVAAVGHETDHTIAEYVADLRAPTPSAAAEIVTCEREEQLQQFQKLTRYLKQALYQSTLQARHRLQGILRHSFFSKPEALLGHWMQQLDDLKDGIDRTLLQRLQKRKLQLDALARHKQALNPLLKLQHSKQKLKGLEQSLNTCMLYSLQNAKKRFQHTGDVLHSINPRVLLSKGYTILFSEKDGSVVSSIDQLQLHDKIRLNLVDGQAIAEVREVHAFLKDN